MWAKISKHFAIHAFHLFDLVHRNPFPFLVILLSNFITKMLFEYHIWSTKTSQNWIYLGFGITFYFFFLSLFFKLNSECLPHTNIYSKHFNMCFGHINVSFGHQSPSIILKVILATFTRIKNSILTTLKTAFMTLMLTCINQLSISPLTLKEIKLVNVFLERSESIFKWFQSIKIPLSSQMSHYCLKK